MPSDIISPLNLWPKELKMGHVALKSFGLYNKFVIMNEMWWIIMAFSLVIHMRWPETQPDCVNAPTGLVISGFSQDALPISTPLN